MNTENYFEIEELLRQMEGKDTSAAYGALLQLERISDESGLLYKYTQKFADMVDDEKYIMRVRGFRLFCKQAKWDTEYKIDENIDSALKILNDSKPTAVRQALAALHEVMQYKPELQDTVCKAASNINYLEYKDTMHSLIAKDIQRLLNIRTEASKESN